MATPREVILKVKKNVDNALKEYATSPEFEEVAKGAAVDFVKRVQRGIMPDGSKIDALTSEKYIELRKRNSSNLGEQGKPNKSNATATGQMLKALTYSMKPNGFLLFIKPSARSGELNNSKSKLNNYDVAGYYRLVRDIFDFSDPEIQRIIRKVRTGLLKIIRRSK